MADQDKPVRNWSGFDACKVRLTDALAAIQNAGATVPASRATGEPTRWVMLTLPSKAGQSLESVWAAVRGVDPLQGGEGAFNGLRRSLENPRLHVAGVTEGGACHFDARHASGVHRVDIRQLGLAGVAFHAGWKVSPLTRLSLRDPV